MTPERRTELRDWSALAVMKFKPFFRGTKWGWVEGSLERFPKADDLFIPWEDWRPDDPTTGQIWMVVERMRELEYNLDLSSFHNVGWWQTRFTKFDTDRIVPSQDWVGSKDSPCLAILIAAKDTEAMTATPGDGKEE